MRFFLPLLRSLFSRSTHASLSAAASMASDAVKPSSTRIGWIGTGVMGLSMCTHLINAGYSLTVFNRTLSKAQPLVDLGAYLAPSPAALAARSDVVFSIVGFPSDVRSVLLDPSAGALSSLSPGAVLVDMTTSDPSLAVSISDAAAAKGCHSIDAPVSGGDRGAKSGTLSIFAGGDESTVAKLAPLFKLLGTVYYMGGPGKGQFAKLANQITIASTMVGLVEGMVYAHKAGLDLTLFLEAISKGAAGSKSLELYGDRILKRDFEPGFYVDHFVKDLGICLKECERMGIALPGLALAQQLYLSLKAHGQGKLGTQALILTLERINNVSLDSVPAPQGDVWFENLKWDGILKVAKFCSERMHEIIAEEWDKAATDGHEWRKKWEAVFCSAFRRADEEVLREAGANDMVGSTAVVSVLSQCQIIVSNCGDSRAVLCRRTGTIPLTIDQKPDREDELKRIEEAGGKVINWNGARVLGVLAMSRSIGDHYMRPYVIPVPEVTFMTRTDEDECLILASDGLWDVMSNDEVGNLARRLLKRQQRNMADDGILPAKFAADNLQSFALAKNSSDNISIIVVDLKARRRRQPRQ